MNVRGWKNVRMDMMTTWGQFKFEIGRTYIQEGEIELCKNGFHFHRNPFGLFTYYSFDLENVGVLEIEAGGVIVDGEDKSVCSEITIVRQLTLEQVKELGNMANNMGWGNTGDWNTGDLNTGDRNTGYRNTGYRNTGYRNTGDLNTGYRNTGYRNTGDRNTGDRNTGDLNTGYRNTGYRNTGDLNTGYRNTGYRNTGDLNTGYRNTGDRNTGYRNTGDWNTGDLNTGDRNTGYWNTGDLNTGYRNTGYRNTGDWNRCDNSNGFFNSVEPETVLVFNKPCRIGVWQSARIPDFLYFEERWSDIKSYITKEGIEQLTALPNFDGEVFREVSGFSLDDLKYFEVLFRKF